MAATGELRGKVAIVTGGSRGIGRAMSLAFAAAGAQVVVASRTENEPPPDSPFIKYGSGTINDTARQIAAAGGEALAIPCDVTKSEDLRNLADRTVKHFGRIDIVVSNAGVNVFEGAANCTEEQWNFNMALNLKSHWQISKLCKPYLEKNEKGVILIMTSNHSDYTIPGCFPYNVSKTALKGLVQSLAIEWGPKIRTVGVAPGFIDTKGNQKWFDSTRFISYKNCCRRKFKKT